MIGDVSESVGSSEWSSLSKALPKYLKNLYIQMNGNATMVSVIKLGDIITNMAKTKHVITRTKKMTKQQDDNI